MSLVSDDSVTTNAVTSCTSGRCSFNSEPEGSAASFSWPPSQFEKSKKLSTPGCVHEEQHGQSVSVSERVRKRDTREVAHASETREPSRGKAGIPLEHERPSLEHEHMAGHEVRQGRVQGGGTYLVAQYHRSCRKLLRTRRKGVPARVPRGALVHVERSARRRALPSGRRRRRRRGCDLFDRGRSRNFFTPSFFPL